MVKKTGNRCQRSNRRTVEVEEPSAQAWSEAMPRCGSTNLVLFYSERNRKE